MSASRTRRPPRRARRCWPRRGAPLPFSRDGDAGGGGFVSRGTDRPGAPRARPRCRTTRQPGRLTAERRVQARVLPDLPLASWTCRLPCVAALLLLTLERYVPVTGADHAGGRRRRGADHLHRENRASCASAMAHCAASRSTPRRQLGLHRLRAAVRRFCRSSSAGRGVRGERAAKEERPRSRSRSAGSRRQDATGSSGRTGSGPIRRGERGEHADAMPARFAPRTSVPQLIADHHGVASARARRPLEDGRVRLAQTLEAEWPPRPRCAARAPFEIAASVPQRTPGRLRAWGNTRVRVGSNKWGKRRAHRAREQAQQRLSVAGLEPRLVPAHDSVHSALGEAAPRSTRAPPSSSESADRAPRTPCPPDRARAAPEAGAPDDTTCSRSTRIPRRAGALRCSRARRERQLVTTK